MSRKAIIIDCGHGNENGAVWKKFLSSSIGGAYDENEITVLCSPSSENEIISAVESASKSDYAFVVFSGKSGCYECCKDKFGLSEIKIHFGNGNVISERILNPGEECSRCTIMLDCCESNDDISDMITGVSVYDRIANKETENEINSYCRNMYDEYIGKCDCGCTKIYSTEGENASLKMILNACEENHDDILDLFDSVENLKNDKIKYYGGRRNHHFPFAVYILSLKH